MAQLREFRLEVFLENGTHLETNFTQMLEPDQAPAARFYLGYSSDRATQRDLPWITVGDIAYLPEEVVAVKVAPADARAREHGLRAL